MKLTLPVKSISPTYILKAICFAVITLVSRPAFSQCTPPVINAPTVTQPTCAVPSGSIVVFASGVNTLEYSIDGGTTWQSSNAFNNLAPGSYNIVVRLQSQPACFSTYGTNPVIINPLPNPPTVNAPTVTQPTCATPTGTIVVSATGVGTLEYSINGGPWQVSNTFSGLAPGNYNISVRLQTQPTCVTAYSGNPVVINPVPTPPTVNAPTITVPTCAVPTGTIVVNATGSGTLEYSIDGGTTWQASNTFSGLIPGNYNISARLQSSPTCVTTYSGNPAVVPAVPTPPTVNAPTITQPTCAVPTGTIVVNATGSGTLEYSINGGPWQTSNSFSGLAPGNYNISVRLQSSPTCVTAYSGNPVVIDVVPTPPTVNAPTVTQPTCAVPTGTIVVNATGSGTLEYSIDGFTWQTSNVFSGLGPDLYDILVRLQSSPTCMTEYSNNPVRINVPPVPPTINAPTVTQPTCAVPTGTIVVNATGSGTLEYSDDGGATWQTSNTFSSLTPGNYNISVRLQSSTTCVTAYSGNPVVINAVPTPPTVNAPTITQPTCAVPTGTIVVNATGSGTLEYSINGTTWQVSNAFSGLAPGNYNISVRLQSSPTCVTAYSGNPVIINAAPTPPTVNAPTITQPTCAVPTGTIIVNATGSGTLEYSIDGGTTWQLSNTFSGLAPGNYNISARLQSSTTCVTAYSGNPVVINAVPTPPTVNAPAVTQPTCSVPTGTIVVNATGSGTLEYSVDGGSSWQASNTFNGLTPNLYDIFVRLQSSPTCVTAYSSNPVVINAAPLIPLVNAPTVTQPDCATATGTIIVNATGVGTLEYSLNGTTWQLSNTFTNLAPGTYNISVRLQSSPDCIGTFSGNPVVINPQPIAPTAGVVANKTICDGGSTTFTVSATGTPTPTYQWQIDQGSGFTNILNNPPFSGATTATLTITGATTAYNGNTFRVVVTNVCGTVNSNAATLTVNPLPTIVVTPNGSCAPVVLTASGADTYSWSPSTGLSATTGTTVTASPAANTVYTVTGTITATGCQNTGTVSVSGSASAAVLSGTTGICPSGTANIKVTITGGVSPFTVVYSDGTTNTTVNGYTSGSNIPVSPAATTTYTLVSVTGANGCSGTGLSGNAVITVNPVPTISVGPNNQCGPVSLTATGTSNTYSWSPAAGLSATTGATVTANPTVNTIYTVTGTITATGCQNSATVSVNATPAAPVITPSSVNICVGSVVTLTSSAGPTPAVWSPVTGLYTDGAATIPYVAGTQTNTVYAKPATSISYSATTASATCTSLPGKDSITVIQAISITTQPANQTVCSGANVTFSVVTPGASLPGGNLQSYQWQVKVGAGSFTNIAGANNSSLVLPNVATSLSTNQYRVVITNTCFTVTSNAATLTVNATPTVTVTPLQNRICVSDTLVALSGSPVGGSWSGTGVSGFNFIPMATGVGSYTLTYSFTNASGCSASATTVANVQDCQERIRLLRDDAVILFPNPNNGRFFIRMNSTLYAYLGMRVYSSHGALVRIQQFGGLVYGRVVPIDLRYLPSDVYMVEFYYDDGIRTSKKFFKVIIAH